MKMVPGWPQMNLNGRCEREEAAPYGAGDRPDEAGRGRLNHAAAIDIGDCQAFCVGSQRVGVGRRRHAGDIDRERSDAQIDLLFSDVVMPGGMSGPQLAEQALLLRPALRVLYTSGYTENTLIHQGRVDPGMQLLNKPYRRHDLAAKLRAVLQSS